MRVIWDNKQAQINKFKIGLCKKNKNKPND